MQTKVINYPHYSLLFIIDKSKRGVDVIYHHFSCEIGHVLSEFDFIDCMTSIVESQMGIVYRVSASFEHKHSIWDFNKTLSCNIQQTELIKCLLFD